MKITHDKLMNGAEWLYAFSISFSKRYGMIGIDFGRHSINIILYSPKNR